MTEIRINDDLQDGYIYSSEMCEGDIITVYGVIYEIGLDYGDGEGATMRKVEMEKCQHHHTVDEIDLAHELPTLTMTAAEYDRLAGGCLADELGGDTVVSIHPENTYTVGEYEGSLI